MDTSIQGELNVEFKESDIFKAYGISVNKMIHTPTIRNQFVSVILTKAKEITDLTFKDDDELDVSFIDVEGTTDRYRLTVKKKRRQILLFELKGNEVEKIMDTVNLDEYGLKEKLAQKE